MSATPSLMLPNYDLWGMSGFEPRVGTAVESLHATDLATPLYSTVFYTCILENNQRGGAERGEEPQYLLCWQAVIWPEAVAASPERIDIESCWPLSCSPFFRMSQPSHRRMFLIRPCQYENLPGAVHQMPGRKRLQRVILFPDKSFRPKLTLDYNAFMLGILIGIKQKQNPSKVLKPVCLLTWCHAFPTGCVFILFWGFWIRIRIHGIECRVR